MKHLAKKLTAALCAGAFVFALAPGGGVAEASVYSGVRAARTAQRAVKTVKRESDKAKKRRAEKQRQKDAAAAKKDGKNRPPAPQTKPQAAPSAKAGAKFNAKETAPFFPAAKVDALAATAKKLIGTKYVYGGTTPKGFDCSGFLQYIFKQHGAKIPRTADAQYDVGRRVLKTSALVKGDLVFFTDGREISHCGLYLGGGKFIHASSSRGVRIDALSDGYWKPRYAGGKHVIK